MSDLELALENPFSESLKERSLPFYKSLTPEQRIEAIVEILALAVLRGQFRKRDHSSSLIDLSDD